MTATLPTAAPAGERARYLDAVSAVLWPAPAAVAVGGRRQRRERGGRAEEYLVLPHASRPKLVVPVARRAAAAAVGGFNAGRSRRALVLSGPLSLALRAGLGRAFVPGRLLVRHPAETLRGYLSEVLGQEVFLSFSLGPPRANQKPVAQLIGRRGDIVGYAKIGINDLTRALVEHEAAALALLAGAGTRAVTVPAVRHLGHWRDASVLLLDPLPAWRRPPVRTAGRLLSDAMTEVAAVTGLTTAPLAASPYLEGLGAGLAALGERGEPFHAVLRLAADRAGGTELAFGAWHGDWTRSNVAPRGSTVLAWDWERFAAGVPAGFDALHYHLQQAIYVSRRPPRAAAGELVSGAATLLAPFGDQARPAAARLVAVLYLAELAHRYLRDRQQEAGARLGDPHRWALPALAAAVEELA
jgi:hypothetical protein